MNDDSENCAAIKKKLSDFTAKEKQNSIQNIQYQPGYKSHHISLSGVITEQSKESDNYQIQQKYRCLQPIASAVCDIRLPDRIKNLRDAQAERKTPSSAIQADDRIYQRQG